MRIDGDFPKLGVPFWGSHNKDYLIQGNYHIIPYIKVMKISCALSSNSAVIKPMSLCIRRGPCLGPSKARRLCIIHMGVSQN